MPLFMEPASPRDIEALRESIEESSAAAARLTRWMIALTIILVILTTVLVVLTVALVVE